jgi:hypothetical protein
MPMSLIDLNHFFSPLVGYYCRSLASGMGTKASRKLRFHSGKEFTDRTPGMLRSESATEALDHPGSARLPKGRDEEGFSLPRKSPGTMNPLETR